jgi:hypothetical protein
MITKGAQVKSKRFELKDTVFESILLQLGTVFLWMFGCEWKQGHFNELAD